MFRGSPGMFSLCCNMLVGMPPMKGSPGGALPPGSIGGGWIMGPWR